ncbi:MAG: glycine dehydrogenase (aminomethyl-transferring), partial [Acidobacteriota bacterium]
MRRPTASWSSKFVSDAFQSRHIGPRADDIAAMLRDVGAASVDALIDEIVPADIHLRQPLRLPDADSEFEYHRRLRTIAAKNQVTRSYIGLGYHDTIVPAVIQRNVFENPGWYTPYTPYQAEIAQGRLESLLNFQTMVTDLTGMEVANASLLDEATAAAEAMALLWRVHKTPDANTFHVCEQVFPHVRDVMAARAKPLGIELRVVNVSKEPLGPHVFGIYVQTPDDKGAVLNLSAMIAHAHDAGVLVAVGTDLLALALVTPPGDQGADIVVGNAQRFGVPLGYGGPHAAFFATRERFIRQA